MSEPLIMDEPIRNGLVAGTERLTAWADLLDGINVFPVADGDTGRNLVASLSPLRRMTGDPEETARLLLMAARGNSGNIAARFLSEFICMNGKGDLFPAAQKGRDAAREAVKDPKPGTMLTLFDALVEVLQKEASERRLSATAVIDHLSEAVLQTTTLLPVLESAGVVDAGALGMFLLFEGFFESLVGDEWLFTPLNRRFPNRLQISPDYQARSQTGHCIQARLRLNDRTGDTDESIAALGDSVVVTPDRDSIQVHFHTSDRTAARSRMEALGRLTDWSEEALTDDAVSAPLNPAAGPIHLMTDAAGSLTRSNARRLGMTLLDSYLLVGDKSLPETHYSPESVYAAMRSGVPVSTSQASIFERSQHYQSVLDRHHRVLYLCVGSVYTGNYEAAVSWKAKHDPGNRLTVLDTGAASGRLAAMVLATVGYAQQTDDPEAVIRFAKAMVPHCEEYLFLDRLHYLAAGGRLSKTGAFFGDMLHLKPVITPTAQGAKKVGMVRDRKAQLAFALDKLEQALRNGPPALVLLEYSDNREWVETEVQETIGRHCPGSEIRSIPLSLTSGAHMGPGTWGMAFCREPHPDTGLA
ncbi:MAG: DegV family protein [Thermodesulfobacteriota bacterium]